MPEKNSVPARPGHVAAGRWTRRIILAVAAAILAWPAVPAAPARAAGFDDTRNHWAEQAVDRMNAKGLIRGTAGRFEPNRAVSRYEAIIMIVRGMGLEEVARTRVNIPASFRDAAVVPAWAKGYVGEAVDRGLITADESAGFNGNAAATRLQVAAWLARALDLEAESAAEQGAPFADTGSVNARYRGYIAALAGRNLMTGAQGKFRPYDPLTRAEMATLLARMDRLLDNGVDRAEVRGTVYGTADGLTVMLSGGARRAFALAPDVRVYFKGKSTGPAFLAEGDAVVVITDSGGRAAFVEVLSEGFRVEGTLTGVETGGIPAVEMERPGGERARYLMAPDALVLLDGKAASPSHLRAGQQVTLEGEEQRVTRVVAASPVEERRGWVTSVSFAGNVVAVRFAGQEGAAEDRTYTVTAGVALTKDGMPARIYDVRVDDRVTVKLRGGQLAGLAVDSYQRTVEGTLREVVFGSVYSNAPQLVIDLEGGGAGGSGAVAGRRVTYLVARSVEVRKDGQTVGLTALRPGDAVEIGLTGDEVTSVKAETRYSQVEGTLTRITLAEANEITVKMSNGLTQAYRLAPDVTVRVGQTYVSLASLKPGVRVKLTVAYDVVTAISSVSPAWLEDIRGVVRYVDVQQNTIVVELTPDGGMRHVKADSGLIVVRSGQVRDRLSSLSAGDAVIIVGRDVPGEPFSAKTVVVTATSE